MHTAVVCDQCWIDAGLSYLAGMSMSKIARELQVGKTSVQTRFARIGLRPDDTYRKQRSRSNARRAKQIHEAVEAYYKTERGIAAKQDYRREYYQKHKS
jgi:transposase